MTKTKKSDYYFHKCAVCGTEWFSKNENPTVCNNIECSNRTHWKDGNIR